MGSHRAASNRRSITVTAGVVAAGALLLGGPAAMASAAPAEPDNSIGGFLSNAGQFAGALGTNTGQLIGTGGTNLNQFVGTGGTNLNQFVGTAGTNAGQFLGTGGTNAGQFLGTLGTNGLIFTGTLANNLVGNPPNAGARTAGANRMASLATSQCVAGANGYCDR